MPRNTMQYTAGKQEQYLDENPGNDATSQEQAEWAQAKLEQLGGGMTNAHRIMEAQLNGKEILDTKEVLDTSGNPTSLQGKLAQEFHIILTGADHPKNPSTRYVQELVAGNTEGAAAAYQEIKEVMLGLSERSAEFQQITEGRTTDLPSDPRAAWEKVIHEMDQNQSSDSPTEELRFFLNATAAMNLRPGGDTELAQQAYTIAKSLETSLEPAEES